MEGCIESKHYAAVDIGASSGRVLAGWVEDGKMSYQESTASITSRSA